MPSMMGSRALTDDLCILPDEVDEGVGGVLEESNDILVERVHVLHQPLVGRVIHATSVVDQSEVRVRPEFGLLEFRVLQRR